MTDGMTGAGGAARGGPSMASQGWSLGLIGALYAWQGLVAGFALTAVPNHYAALGATTAAIGAHFATVGLPWVLQPLWGPVVDRFTGHGMGRRRAWVILAFLGSLLSLARLLLVGEEGAATLPAISAVFLVQGAFACLADTATDAMSIDRVAPDRLGTLTAVTRVGFVGGGAVGAALFSWMIGAHGLRATTLLLLGLGLAILLLPLLVRERPEDPFLTLRAAPGPRGAPEEGLAALLGRLARLLVSRDTLGLIAVCFAVDAAAAVFAVPLGVELIQGRGWSAESLSRLQAGAGLAAGTLGAVAVGWWADRAGARRALTALLALCALAHAAAGLLLVTGGAPLLTRIGAPAALVLSIVVPALVFVALAPAVMRRSFGALAATRFALFMAALNLGSVAGAGASGAVSAAIGLPATGIAAGVAFAVLAVAGWGVLAERE